MAKRKDKTKIAGQFKLPASRKPYYYQVYLWETIDDLRDYFEVNTPEDGETMAMTCFEPWYVDDSTGNVYINPKLGELHFARDHWSVNIVAHEVQHAIIHRMRLVWPPAHLILLDEYADAEEEIAYETGNWTESVYRWLHTQDPGDGQDPCRATFEVPQYTSKVRFPKSKLKLITAKPPSHAKPKGPKKQEGK